MDFQVRTERWPEPGETLPASDFLMAAGGKAANVAYLARRLDSPAVLVARVGDDVLAGQALGPLRELDVDLQHVRPVVGQSTGTALIDVRADGEKVILMAANANGAWSDDDAEACGAAVRAAPEGSVLAIDLEVPPAVVRRALEGARESGHVIVLDPSPADRLDDEVAKLVDYVTPNESEAEQMTDVTVESPRDALRAGERLVERGVGTALVKLGGGGCVLVRDGLRLHARPSPRDAVDTTGAGDAFAGGLAVALLEERSPAEALRFAVACGALAVCRFGSQAAYPTREELEQELPDVTIRSGDDLD